MEMYILMFLCCMFFLNINTCVHIDISLKSFLVTFIDILLINVFGHAAIWIWRGEQRVRV